MAQYLLIESRDPFESNNVGYYYDLAKGLGFWPIEVFALEVVD